MELNWLTEGSVIQAGGIAVGLVALFAIIFVVQKFTRIIGNHMEHELIAREKEAQSQEKMAGTLSELSTTIRDYFKK